MFRARTPAVVTVRRAEVVEWCIGEGVGGVGGGVGGGRVVVVETF